MRSAALILIGALGLATAPVLSANAAPTLRNLDAKASSDIVQVSGGCGWGFHRTYWGGCVPNRYGYYRPWRPYYWRPHYYGWGYHPYWHRRGY